MGRRGPDDIEWQKCKQEVARRDGGVCCFCKTMSGKDYNLFMKSFAPADVPFHMLKVIDPAHRKTAGTNLGLIYDPDNVFQYFRLDIYKNKYYLLV